MAERLCALRPALAYARCHPWRPSASPMRGERRIAAGRDEVAGCSEGEQEEQRDQEREDAERLGHREAEDQVAELALRGRRSAQRRGEILAEDDADADAGATHADTGDASADEFRCGRFHEEAPFEVGR